MPASPLQIRLAERRRAQGWTMTALAEAVGVSRQALTAIEAGRATPSTLVALRLARVLGCPVEVLFQLAEGGVPGARSDAPVGSRVSLARVGERWVAHALPPLATEPADGLVTAGGGIEALADLRRLEGVALVAGCAPFLGALAGHLSHAADAGARWLLRTSRGSVQALARGETHLAGLHLAAADDPSTHARLLHAHLPDEAVDIVEVVSWREGLALAPGNPRGIQGPVDLASPGLRVAQRPPGAGATAVLRRALTAVGLTPDGLAGPAVASHIDAAVAIRHGAADAAVLVEPVATAFGLPFLPLSEERFELALRRRDRGHVGVRRLLERLNDARFAREVRAMGAYDTARMGTVRPLEVA